MKRVLLYSFLLTAMALSFAACNQEDFVESEMKDNDLSFAPSLAKIDDGYETKSMEIASEDGSIVLPLQYVASDGIYLTSSGDSQKTKAAQYNTASDLQTYVGSFKVIGFNSDDSQFVPVDGSQEATVTYGSGKWNLSGTSPVWYPSTKTFFAYANLPSGASVICPASGNHTFEYPEVPDDATNQLDALLGYYQGDGNVDGKAGVAKIQFVHPLTAVVFKMGSLEGAPITAIKSIEIEGVYKSGTADVTYSYNTLGETVPAFDWGSTRNEKKNVSQTVGNLPSAGSNIGVPFIIIPQDLNTVPIVLNIILDEGGEEKIIRAELNSGEWKEGKTNTYTIGYDFNEYNVLEVEGEVHFPYDKNDFVGESQNFIVNSDSPWKIQYSLDNGNTWNDFADSPNMVMPDGSGRFWFSTFSGPGSDDAQTVTVDYCDNPYYTEDLDFSAALRSKPVKGTEDAPYDLSMHTIYGESRTTPVTANSYVVDAPGWYAFPLVYGNAIDYTKNPTDGDNVPSYHPSGPTSSDFLSPFKGANGDITSPFIPGVQYAFPLWEDVPDYSIIANTYADCHIITASEAASKGLVLGGRCGYVVFHVNEGDNLTSGNAVIAVSDGNSLDNTGNILWSWHIWTTAEDLTCKHVINRTASFNGDMMPYDLGWISSNSKQTVYPPAELLIRFVQMKGSTIMNEVRKTVVKDDCIIPYIIGSAPRYAFGRKDPKMRDKPDDEYNSIWCFPPQSSDPRFNEFNIGEYSGEKYTSDATLHTIMEDVSHPTIFNERAQILGVANMWSATKHSFADLEPGFHQAPVKTVYDPCPPGFQVPQGDVFNFWSSIDADYLSGDDIAYSNIKKDTNLGTYFYTRRSLSTEDDIFFPISSIKAAMCYATANTTYGDISPNYHCYFTTSCLERHNIPSRVAIIKCSQSLTYRTHAGYFVRPVAESTTVPPISLVNSDPVTVNDPGDGGTQNLYW